MKRTKCGSCGGDKLAVILDLGLSPIADAYTSTATELSTLHPLQLAECGHCHLVQLMEILSQDALFGTGYSFYSSASAPLSEYHRVYAEDVINRFNWTGTSKKFIVELGCNDGDMLRHFQGIGANVLGIDPAEGPAEAAVARGIDHVMIKPFTRALALEIHAQRGSADIIIANHVLAHVEDVSNFLAGVAELLSPTGVAYVEVQYLPDMLLNNAFDLVYHEHRNFFSFRSLEKAVENHGLVITHAKLTDRQGGSLRVQIRHGKRGDRLDLSLEYLRASEDWLTYENAYSGLQDRAERIKTRLLDLLDGKVFDTGKIAGYGAPAKATTLLNFCGITSDHLDFVIDTTAAKQGRFIPGTGIPIIGPNDGAFTVDTMVLLAWNYAGHIIRKHLEWTDSGGRWIVPIPVPTVI